MKLSKPSSKYRTISLSELIVNNIREIIKDNPNYRSTADYVNQALREKMEREDTTAIGTASALLKMMESKGFKKEVGRIRKSGMPEEIGVLSDLAKELESDMVEKQKIEEHGKKMIDLYQKQKQEYRKRCAKGIDDWVLQQHQQNEDQEIKKEPVIQLSESKLNELIQRIDALEKRKKIKKGS